jgi:hypothetical protein
LRDVHLVPSGSRFYTGKLTNLGLMDALDAANAADTATDTAAKAPLAPVNPTPTVVTPPPKTVPDVDNTGHGSRMGITGQAGDLSDIASDAHKDAKKAIK